MFSLLSRRADQLGGKENCALCSYKLLFLLSAVLALLFANLYKGLLLSALLVTGKLDVIDSADKYIHALETGRAKYLIASETAGSVDECEYASISSTMP